MILPRTWHDGDGWLMNYVGHSGHGAAAGFIWLSHDPNGAQPLSRARDYWLSGVRAMIWSAVYGVQFEAGPLSEASIGNVGLDPRTTRWGNYVVTPVGGFGVPVCGHPGTERPAPWRHRPTDGPANRLSQRRTSG